jgi:hypothetical protein
MSQRFSIETGPVSAAFYLVLDPFQLMLWTGPGASSALGSSLTSGGAAMGHDDLVIIGRVIGALVIGALIGFERTFHGRPAGFRTHSLVCIASAILMIVTVYQNQWMTFVEHDAIRTDPTRMAQGIMTGIGFLGAGVIFKEGLTVRGLTTAASIWVTAAIGILVGIGFGLLPSSVRWPRSSCWPCFAILNVSYQASSTRITCSDLHAIT